MCGIFAVVGKSDVRKDAGDQVLQGLKRLEYRGYDSWGIAVVEEAGELKIEKHIGKISAVNSLTLPSASVAIGHTRWATHGGVTKKNAHPHSASDGSFALAQNGIVQNYLELKAELVEAGFEFVSETDTEVIVHLIELKQRARLNLVAAVRAAFTELTGRNTIIVLSQDGQVIAARNGSPLILGRNSKTGTLVFSSDTLSFAGLVDEILVVENNQMIEVESQSIEIELSDVKTAKKVAQHFSPFSQKHAQADHDGFPHFMLKEIFDTPEAIQRVIDQPALALETLAKVLKQAPHVYTIGSGTAGIAAAQIAFYLRKFAQLDVSSLVGADAIEYLPLLQKDDVLIAPSQSGETADVLEILEQAKAKGCIIVSYVNMVGSSMTRLVDFSFLAQAGPEICVMSTKIFTSQICWGYLLAKTVARQLEQGKQELENLAEVASEYLQNTETDKNIHKIAELLIKKSDIFLLGKGENLQLIREGMVKLIEGSYIHAHAIPAGDLKHYAITLMEKGVPVIVLCSDDQGYKDSMNAADQVEARGAEVIIVGPAKLLKKRQKQQATTSSEKYLFLPEAGEASAILGVLPLQLLAYHLAVKLGHDVDHPRNIAKSVTVK